MVYVWESIIDHALAGEMKKAAKYFGPKGSRSVVSGCERGRDAIDSVVMPTTEVMIAVAERFECDYLPSPEKVAGWAAEVLRVFDAERGGGWVGAAERRRIIEDTFASLARVVEKQSDAAPSSDSMT